MVYLRGAREYDLKCSYHRKERVIMLRYGSVNKCYSIHSSINAILQYIIYSDIILITVWQYTNITCQHVA